MTKYIPQYAKSTDPEVIKTVEANKARIAEFNDRAHAFQDKYGDDSADGAILVWSHLDDRRLGGVIARKKPTDGQWKVAGRRGGAWEPFKNNPLRAEFDAVKCKGDVPKGLSEYYLTGYSRREGTYSMHSPQTFVHDGVAYMGLGGSPLADQSGGWGDGTFDTAVWAEILGSEFMAALDAYNERRKAEAR
jgi:hypothetical protein